GIDFNRFTGDCAIPVCIGSLHSACASIVPIARVDTPTWRAPRGWEPVAGPVPPESMRVKSSDCRACLFDPVCGGLATVYARRYGLGELRPVGSRRTRARISARRRAASSLR
ncbi:MAG: hypothetical protein WC943_13710, partial [Elusimicrobiota bacterium]